MKMNPICPNQQIFQLQWSYFLNNNSDMIIVNSIPAVLSAGDVIQVGMHKYIGLIFSLFTAI